MVFNPISVVILDKSHRCLVLSEEENRFSLPSFEKPVQERLLPIVQKWYREEFGDDLPSPCGQFGALDAMSLTFIVQTKPQEGAKLPHRWVRLWDLAEFLSPGECMRFWQQYDANLLGGFSPPSRRFDVFSFAFTEEAASRLAHMVTMGKKRGTAFWVTETEKDKEQFFPFIGALSLVTDGYGFPRCFIETQKTTVVSFCDVPQDFAQIEGEGDQSFADWQDGHRRYFEEEGKRNGLTFSESSKIFLEEFSVIKIL